MQAEDYLKLIEGMRGPAPAGFPYNSQEQFILRNGRSFHEHALHEHARGTARACFYNSMQLALQHAQLTYVEGYACSVIPVMHAWCVDPQDRIVDITWSTPGTSYFGVTFSRKYLQQQVPHCARNNWWGLIDNPMQRWPLVSGKHSQFAAERLDRQEAPC